MANSFIDAQKNHRQKKIFMVCAVLGVIALLYLCGRGAYYMEKNPDTGAFIAILMSTMDIGEHPFAVTFRGNFVQVLVPVNVMACLAYGWSMTTV